jgi:hypothetical protein
LEQTLDSQGEFLALILLASRRLSYRQQIAIRIKGVVDGPQLFEPFAVFEVEPCRDHLKQLAQPLSLVDRQSRIAEHVRSQRLALDREKSFARFQERQITHHHVTS